MLHQDVGQPGRESAPDRDRDVTAHGVERQGAELLDRVVFVVARGDRNPRADRGGDDVVVEAGRQGCGDDVDALGQRVARREVDGVGLGAERVGDLGELGVVTVGQQHAIDARSVDELPRGPRSYGADADDERGGH